MTILRYLGYAGFFLLSFVVGLYLTFPWDVAKDRIFALVNKPGELEITAASLEPSWLTGVEAKKVEIKLGPKGDKPLKFETLTARVKLLSLIRGKQGVVASTPVGKGKLKADVTNDANAFDLEATADDVDLAQFPLLADLSGLPMTGKATFDAKIFVHKKDPKLTKGEITIKAKGLKIDKGGKLGPIPVPALELGDFDLLVPIAEGKAELKNQRIRGADLEIMLDGTFNPMMPFGKSTMNLTVGFKPTEKLLNAEPLLRPLLNNFNSSKNPEGFYGIGIAGSVQFPRTMPRRP